MISVVPLATYRLQLTSSFTFDDAAAIAPYLKEIGISHVYVSPFLKARRGSTHGYDVVDHSAFNPELGGEDGFERFSAALKQNKLGLILDFVPNHMGVHDDDNAWWLDVLEWGPKSPYATSFDIDWDMLPFRRKAGVLLPILGSSYGEALESGKIELRFDNADGSFSAWYFEHRLPIAPERYSDILRRIVEAAAAEESVAGRALLAIAARYTGPHNPERQQAPLLKRALADAEETHALIANGLAAYRAGEHRPAETLALHLLLERQHYLIAHWRLASSEINYRRFFDVNSLAGLRIEDRATFERVHGLVKRLIGERKIDGLRLDHIDGLRDPAQYCARLRRLIRDAQGDNRSPFYLVVEKILGEGEPLPHFAGVAGTTGYEWLNVITDVLVEPSGLKTLDETWRQASNETPRFAPVLKASKQRVLETLLASEFTVLTRLLARIAAGHYSTRDYSEDSLRQVLELFVIHFPVYRTYITADGPSANDRQLINETIGTARRNWFSADAGILDFVRDALTLDLVKRPHPLHSTPRVLRFATKLQQFTGPLMAKSMEDTAFYRFPRLLALNEVGGNPESTGLPLAAFHAAMFQRKRQWPHGLTATASHDTKRGEDARMRLAALSELAEDWSYAVGQWKTLNAPLIRTDAGQRSPGLADEYFIYQALVGALPIGPIEADFITRFKAYMQKALREAKLDTSWLNPNTAYEQGVERFVGDILDPRKAGGFLESLKEFARRAALLGALNTLSQLTLKVTMPGIPDFYQGTELFDFSFVDPDNRRAVDYEARRSLVGVDDILRQPEPDWQNGALKFAWMRRLLQLRQHAADIFTDGDYAGVEVTGADREHVIAFVRRRKRHAVLVVVLRFFSPFTNAGRFWPKFNSIDARITFDERLGRLFGRHKDSLMELGPLLNNWPAAIVLGERDSHIDLQTHAELLLNS